MEIEVIWHKYLISYNIIKFIKFYLGFISLLRNLEFKEKILNKLFLIMHNEYIMRSITCVQITCYIQIYKIFSLFEHYKFITGTQEEPQALGLTFFRNHLQKFHPLLVGLNNNFKFIIFVGRQTDSRLFPVD